MDRANVIKFMKKLWRETVPNSYAEQAYETAIELLQEGSRWISCSERLPEEKGEYLVTYYYYFSVQHRLDDEAKVGFDSFRGKTSWAKDKHWRVVAWKPLPEPYKEK